MKNMSKSKIAALGCGNSVIEELSILKSIESPFVVKPAFAFQDLENLYLVNELKSFGNLRKLIRCKKIFSEADARFIISWLLVGLKEVHNNGYVHRDIKPENIVIGDDGYPCIIDFGISWKSNECQNSGISGTLGYIAPEVLFENYHNHQIDHYALGIILYELAMRKKPRKGKSKEQIKDQMLKHEICLTKANLPRGWSSDSADLINKLLTNNPECKFWTI